MRESSSHMFESVTQSSDRTRVIAGLVALAVGTAGVFALNWLAVRAVLWLVGGVAVIAMAVGTLLVGTAGEGRPA